MNSRYLALAALAGAAALAQPALAATATTTEAQRVERVTYGDLNLATEQGRKELANRVDKALVKVCRFDADGRLVSSAEEAACKAVARKSTEIQLAQVIEDNAVGG